jgi:hypothetical protein
MGIVAFLALPAVRAIAVRTAKNILILGATATAAYFSNNVFKLQANSAVKSAGNQAVQTAQRTAASLRSWIPVCQ